MKSLEERKASRKRDRDLQVKLDATHTPIGQDQYEKFSAGQTPKYEKMNRAELVAEVERRGSTAEPNETKADLIAFLKEEDAKQAAQTAE